MCARAALLVLCPVDFLTVVAAVADRSAACAKLQIHNVAAVGTETCHCGIENYHAGAGQRNFQHSAHRLGNAVAELCKEGRDILSNSSKIVDTWHLGNVVQQNLLGIPEVVQLCQELFFGLWNFIVATIRG